MSSNVCVLAAVILVFNSVNGQVDDAFRVVNTSYGAIRGIVDAQPQVPVAKFYGIPYAKPPVGPLRFKAPVQPEKWINIRDALQPGNMCIQMPSSQPANIPMSEDCLFLNIFAPQTNITTGLPVMLWIHGGGYVNGNGALYDGTALGQKDVIVVTINYRLNAFGFMSTEDASMPGNYGMMDQVEALKWVQMNIAAFGGDPKQVTIFGESAGSGCVSLLTLSPLTKGLFQRAIMESGVSIAPWSISTAAYRISPRMMTRLIATSVGCSNLEDASKLLSCLQGVDGMTLLNASTAIGVSVDTFITFNPRVEQVFNFLPDEPINLLTRGEFNHIDTLRGFNSDEMVIYITPYITNGTISLDRLDDLQWVNVFNDMDQTYLLRLLKGRNMPFVPTVLPDKIRQVLENNDDLQYIAPIMMEINLVSQRSSEKNHFLYEFNHRPSNSPYPTWANATHADELPFVFGVDSAFVTNLNLFPNLTADDVAVSRQMVEMWTNFAKSGDPTATMVKGGVTWSPYRPDSPNYLFIDPTSELRVWSRMEVFDFYRKVLNVLDDYVSPSDGIVG